MKKQILTLATILLLGVSAFAQNGMTKFEQLPAKAQEFVNTYFKDYTIQYIFSDKEFADVDYKIRFEDGTEIEFNAKGDWTDVSGKKKSTEHNTKNYPLYQFARTSDRSHDRNK